MPCLSEYWSGFKSNTPLVIDSRDKDSVWDEGSRGNGNDGLVELVMMPGVVGGDMDSRPMGRKVPSCPSELWKPPFKAQGRGAVSLLSRLGLR